MKELIFTYKVELVFAAVGAVFGYLLPLFIQFFKWLLRLLRDDQIEGLWFNHFFSSDGENSLFKIEKITISKGFYHKYNVQTNFTDNENATYYGRVINEKDFIIFELHADKHEENVYCRFPTPPIFTDSTILTGLSLAQDFSGLATSGSNLLARKKMNEQQVIEILSERVKTNSKKRTLQVLKRQ